MIVPSKIKYIIILRVCLVFFLFTWWWWKRMHNHASEKKRVATRNLRCTNPKWMTYKPKISVSFVRHFCRHHCCIDDQFNSVDVGFWLCVSGSLNVPALRRYSRVRFSRFNTIISHHFIMTHNRLLFDCFSSNSHPNAVSNYENTDQRTNCIDSITCFIFKILAPPMEFLCFSFFRSSAC